MRRVLIHTSNGKGAVIEMHNDDSGEFYCKVQSKFAAENCPRDEYASMYTLFDDQCVAGIHFNYDLTVNGAHFLLLQLPDSKPEHMDEAKRYLRENRDVVRMNVLKIKEMVAFEMPARNKNQVLCQFCQCIPCECRDRADALRQSLHGTPSDIVEEEFYKWWDDEGSRMRPREGEDHSEHVKRMCRIAWANGSYCMQRRR